VSQLFYALFKTPLGDCGIVWGEAGVVSICLPEASAKATRARLKGSFPSAVLRTPVDSVAETVRLVKALLEGNNPDLDGVELDMSAVSAFFRSVYSAARRIPAGTTCTYGELAQRIGSPGAARAVGQALGKNPFAPIVPCHRVVAANGKLGGFSAHGGLVTKERLLTIERANAQQMLTWDVAQPKSAKTAAKKTRH
jgi:methylated-DNA-[protein]-cysteine S-methyltransferase